MLLTMFACCLFDVSMLFYRQHLTPCEAELTLSGHEKIRITASNYWVGNIMIRTNHVFIGGLPQHLPNQVQFATIRLLTIYVNKKLLKTRISVEVT